MWGTNYFGCFIFLFGTSVHTFGHNVLKNSEDVSFVMIPTASGLGYDVTVYKGNVDKIHGTIGVDVNFTDVQCDSRACSLKETNFTVTIITVSDGFRVQWLSDNIDFQFKDCFDLQKGELNWYGGPEIYQQEWPIEKLNLSGNDPYVVRKSSNFAVPERYWLNSNGAYIYHHERNPLYIDQNIEENGKICFIGKNTGPYINRERAYLTYYLTALNNPKEAHLHAVENYLGKPEGHPNEAMIRQPIWTTWAKYKKYINDSIVRTFAYDILDHGFTGQIEIDEDWETCFGSRIFKPEQFSNITNVIADLHARNLRVTLWAAPFINPECTDLVKEGEEKGYFVKNTNDSMTTVWWESEDARQIDFTNPQAVTWYTNRLIKVQNESGVDGFKFDAGETDYVAQPGVYNVEDQELVPNVFTQNYIETVSQFGDLIEVRSAFRTTKYPFFLRMIDKDSVWGLDDGLQSLVTTLLQLNMVGYPMVLPDMIGGNGYRAQPTLELLIRWTQATVFMPAMQFSYLPWDFAENDELNATEIVRNMVLLHEKYSPDILSAMERSISDGVPTNPPIWWIDPTDKTALENFDEFLLGENILVAPVMVEGTTSREVYLPNGTWIDGNDNETTYNGPVSLTYQAPIDVLPYFIKQ
uniref:Glycoside hydrolase family 31 n=1 Tax=Sitophilus oryzae TaxID=7048 RepID=X2D6S5_SITOR|nr:glycoside hydrolase family 31 [Sitophilus oryzae]